MATIALLAVDWGLSTFRAYALDEGGAVVDAMTSDAGILSVADGDFETTFRREAASFLGGAKDLPIIASGMVTSRQGWVETPYIEAPAGAADIARALVTRRTDAGRVVHFVPGLSRIGADGVPDVMRGEETQIIGEIGIDGGGLMVLPGTHSKWAVAVGGRITGFATFMTGELFDVLRQHSILGRLMVVAEAFDEAAFGRGVDYARADGGEAGGILRRLFSARTLGLFDQLPPTAISAYLSGLLIGTEIVEALASVGGIESKRLTIIGGAELAMRYRRALEQFDIVGEEAAAGVTARGLYRIAQTAGLLEASP